MPQATDEQRATMHKWFGDEISDEGPIRFLRSHGYTLLEGFIWQKPTPSHSVSCYEAECVLFLINEWDWGGVVGGLGEVQCLCGMRLGKIRGY